MIWMLPLTLFIFLIIRKIAFKIKTPLFNPLVISVIVLIPILLVTQTTYTQYLSNVKIINDLLPYSVVALAYPLYELIPQIKARWKSIMIITFTASIASMITGVCIAFWLGGDNEVAASVLPKSVTTAIAVTIASDQGGVPSIAALCVILVGTLGGIFGHQILNFAKIKSASARGLSIGAVSHAVGTARCIEVNYNEGAYSSLSLVLCGIMTSLTAPFLFPIMVFIFNWF
ncbi:MULTISPECIES: CidB/LrgB family autolysis modulator [unclassified Gilliamella]|uniref:CidB/LrgB family autolysis modulator n=1 Tax=unclassified Gilliamella TaxID=2685620 RepID=UPI001C694514|nr:MULTISPECIES: CidB/LrgB family autolysis modulator [unclassified Gilliamella]MCX8601381.1 CidB/LrgB family autolysis modulator [Gilliamella sp. B3722]MCX8608974.1 CidB/LrgB family autolysis modulator [Gilliamella sp. B3771]MCX8610649.1 CidB/LrgB family autolysis modulator [Gilliamella sp. B3891]MCX8613112.1 CidB/LrgB family autolysis modulator [Gilliamella sp. B3773]MCX8615391.1 CidB/LrgB family autolysis modulator [Gilliamella sp. B3770]